MTSSFYLSPTDWTGLLWAIKRLIKASLFLALTLKTLFWNWMWKCDVTPLLRSLSTHHLVRAAVCSIQRDFLRKPWSPGSALLPPTGKGLKLWNVHGDKIWYHFLFLCVIVFKDVEPLWPSKEGLGVFGWSAVISSATIAAGANTFALLCHA